MTEHPHVKKTAADLCVKGPNGSADYNLIESVLPPAVERVVYVLAGVSGLAFFMPQLVPSSRH